MSVIIKGIKKPGNCKECQFFSWSRCYADLTIRFCNFFDENLEIKFEPIGNCPLIELPATHGDLIDVGELVYSLDASDFDGSDPVENLDNAIRIIGSARVIIPGEQET